MPNVFFRYTICDVKKHRQVSTWHIPALHGTVHKHTQLSCGDVCFTKVVSTSMLSCCPYSCGLAANLPRTRHWPRTPLAAVTVNELFWDGNSTGIKEEVRRRVWAVPALCLCLLPAPSNSTHSEVNVVSWVRRAGKLADRRCRRRKGPGGGVVLMTVVST